MKKPSLKDIAREVGVSTALVSYVLNNKKEGRISRQIAQKIKEVAATLNYRTNQIAKSLKTRKTFTLGLILADISNPFSASLARIIEDEANKHGYTVIFGSSDENARKSEKLIDTLLNRQVDGLIISPPANSEEQIALLQKQDVPFVLLDRYFPGIKTNYVAIDNHAASKKAVGHLVANGCKRIGIITYRTSLFHLQQRKAGYLSALKEQHLASKKNWIKEVDISNDRDEIRKAMAELLQGDKIDGVLFASNIIAGHAVRYINSLPIKVPDDLAIVSFDETEALDLFYAPLTYVVQPQLEMGQAATRILLESIGNNNKITQVDMETSIVVRDSSGYLTKDATAS